LVVIEKRFNVELGLDWTSGRPRVATLEDNSHRFGRYLSPRGSKSEIALWLDGFIEGLECGDQAARDARLAAGLQGTIDSCKA